MNTTGMFVFFSVMLIILLIIDFITLNQWRKFVKNRKYNKLFYIVPNIVAIFMMLSFAYSNYCNILVFPVPEYIKYFNIISSLWYLPKIVISFFIVLISLIKTVFNFSTKFNGKSVLQSNDVQIKSQRSKYLGNFAWGIAFIPFLFAINGLFFTVNDVVINSKVIYIPKIHNEHNGLRIVHLSDLHFGNYMSGNKLIDIRNQVNSLQPDLIFITGDFVNFRYQELDYGEEFLRGLNAKYGTYACLGNHDHYMSTDDHIKLVKRLNNTGVHLLINQSKKVMVNGKYLNVIGVDNYGSRQKFGDFEKAFTGVDKKDFNILMSHDPKTWEQFIVENKPADLTLSGHTHGGQVAIGFGDYDFSPAKIMYKQYKGLYNNDNQFLYVNSGLGVTGPPIRLGVNPEITLLTIKKPEFVAGLFDNLFRILY